MPLQAGKLRHRLKLQRRDLKQDGTGEKSPAYSTYATVWGRVDTLTGYELEHAQQVHAEARCRITIRYNPQVVTTDWIVFGDRIFEVAAAPINPEQRNEYLQIICTEVT